MGRRPCIRCPPFETRAARAPQGEVRLSVERSRRITHFAQYTRAQAGFQRLWSREVDWAAENFGEAVTQSGEFVKIRQPFELDENVDITVRAGLATRNRSIDAKPPHARADQLRAIGRNTLEELFAGHGWPL